METAEAVILVAAGIWGAIIAGCIVIQLGRYGVKKVLDLVR